MLRGPEALHIGLRKSDPGPAKPVSLTPGRDRMPQRRRGVTGWQRCQNTRRSLDMSRPGLVTVHYGDWRHGLALVHYAHQRLLSSRLLKGVRPPLRNLELLRACRRLTDWTSGTSKLPSAPGTSTSDPPGRVGVASPLPKTALDQFWHTTRVGGEDRHSYPLLSAATSSENSLKSRM